MDLGSLIVRIGADISGLDRATSDTARGMSAVERAADDMSKAVQGSVDRAAAAAARQSAAISQAATQTASATAAQVRTIEASIGGQQLTQLGGQVETVGISFDALAAAAGAAADDVLASFGEIADGAGGAGTTVTQSMERASEETAKLGDAANEARRQTDRGFEDMGGGALRLVSKFRSLLGVATAVTGAIMGLGYTALPFEDMEDQIIISTGAAGLALENYRAIATEVLDRTAATPVQAGSVVSDLATRLGLEGDALKDAAVTMLDLSRMLKVDPMQLTSGFGQLARNWAIPQADYIPTLDQMFRAGQLAGVPLMEMQRTLTDLGPLFRGLGFDMAESMAVVANAGKAGLDPSTLATGLRQAQAYYAEAGVDMQAGLYATITAIGNSTTAAERFTRAAEVFGDRAAPLFVSAVQSGAFQASEMQRELEGAAGAIERASGATWGWSEAWAHFKTQSAESLAPAGSDLLAGATSVLGWLETGASWLGQFLGSSQVTKDLKRFREAGVAIPDEIARGVTMGQQSAIDALHKMVVEMDQYLPHSDAKRGPFSRLSRSGADFVSTWADGVLSSNAAEMAVYHQLQKVARLLPHSDADEGPLSNISGSGEAFSITFAGGIMSQSGVVQAAGESLMSRVMEPINSLNRIYSHNLRRTRDDTDSYWWQISTIPGAAMRYAADSVLNAVDNMGPMSLTLDLDAMGIKTYGENVLSLSGLLSQVPPLLDDISTSGQDMQLTLDASLMSITHHAEEVQQAWLELDEIVPSVGDTLTLTLGEVAEAGEKMQLTLDTSLGQVIANLDATAAAASLALVDQQIEWSSFYAIDQAQTEQQKLDILWGKLKLGAESLGVDIDAISGAMWDRVDVEWEKALKDLDTMTGGALTDITKWFAQFGIDITSLQLKTGQDISAIWADSVKEMKSIVGKGITDVIVDLTQGGNNMAAIMTSMFDSLIGVIIEFAISSILALDSVAKVLAAFKANPWLAIGAAIAAIAVISVLRSSISGGSSKSTVGAAAEGAYLTQPTMLLAGERGPEYVIPADRMPGASALPNDLFASGRAVGGEVHIHIDVHDNTVSGDREAQALADRLAAKFTESLRRQGVRPNFSY